MAKNLSLRSKLLSTSALAVAGTFWLGASPALAVPLGSCVTAGTSTVTITCTGNTTGQVYTNEANTTITLNPDANVFVNGDVAILMGDENASLIMGANSTAKSHGNGATGTVNAFNSADVTLNGGAAITLEQNNLRDDSYALSVQGLDGSNITLNGGSSVNFVGGSYVNKYASVGGVKAFGEKINITLNGASKINVTGTGEMYPGSGIIHNDYYGIVLENTSETAANRNTVTLNGGSSINVNRSGIQTAGDTIGIYSFASGDDKYASVITLSDLSINVSAGGVSDSDKYAGILGIGGADATVTLNNSTISVTGASTDTDGNNTYAGIKLIQDNISASHVGGVTLNSGSKIIVNASGNGEDSEAYGVSIGTFDEEAAIGAVTLNGGSSITLNLTGSTAYAVGIKAEGLGAKVALNGGSSINLIGSGTGENGDFYGIFVDSYATSKGLAPSITLNGGSSINVSRIGANSYGYAFGIYALADGDDKYAADITLNNSSIRLNSAGASEESKYVGIGSFGGADAHITLNTSTIKVTGESAGDDNKYAGILFYQSNTANAAIGGIALSNSAITVEGNGTGEDAKLFGIAAVNQQWDTKVAPITLNGGSTITLNANGDTKYAFGLVAVGYAPEVTLSGGSSITLNTLGGSTNAKYFGLVSVSFDKYATGNTGRITLNSGSRIELAGAGATQSKYVGILASGSSLDGKYAAPITLNDSFININNNAGVENKYVGIMSIGGGGPITLNGSSQINIGAHYDGVLHEWVGGTDAKAYIGIIAFNDPTLVDAAPKVVLNGSSSVNIMGGGMSPDAKYVGIGILGDGATVTLNGDARVNINVRGAADDVAGIFTMGYNNQITLNDNARVSIVSDPAHPAHGAGLYMTGDGDTLTMNGRSMIEAYYASHMNGVSIYGDGVTVILNDHAVIYGGFDASGIVSAGNGTTVNVGKDAALVGDTGILLSGHENQIHVQGLVIGHTDAINVAGGDTSSVTLDSAQIIGYVVGGGSDVLTLAGSGTLNEGAQGFGQLTMNGDYWNLATGSTNTAESVDVVHGRLAVNGTLDAQTGVTVEAGGSLGGTGTVTGPVTVLKGGAVSPGNSPGTLNVFGPVVFNSGSLLDVEIGATAADLLIATGNVTIDPGAIVQATFFPGADGFVGNIVQGATVTGTFTPGSGTALDYSTPGVVSLTAASSSSMNGGMSAGAAQGFTFLDTVLSEAQKSVSVGKTLWGTALWSQSTRTAASTTSRGFDQHANGGAFGGDVMSSGDFTLGLAAGYLDGDAITSGGGSRTSIEGYHAAVYSTYMFGGTYLTSAVSAAYQDQDAKRNVFASGVLVGAEGSPEAWLGGVGLGIGHAFPLSNAFTLTPRASLAYQHMARDGYTETGGGTGALALDGIDTDTFRGRVGAELALNVADKNAMWAIRPAISAALAQEWRAGDTTTTGTFRTTGAAFNGDLDSRNQTYIALGAGVDMTVGYGITAFVNYDGGTGGDAERSGGWRLGARMEW